jgi:hypothetical protein
MADEITTIHFGDGSAAIIAMAAKDVAALISTSTEGLLDLTTANGHQIFVNPTHVAWVAAAEERRQDVRIRGVHGS